jgi:tRNA-Thr(GGU) m(6)t(6)A37 methyltransferase TsaA
MRYEEQTPFQLYPIGFVHSPFREKMEAPRQGCLANGVRSTIELVNDPRLSHALDGIETWSHLWVLFWFDRDPHFSPKVQPPRSRERRGVLTTRSPHRPNAIGMSVARLVERKGAILVMDGLDLLDRTPVVDLKPYVSYADRIDDATSGWLPLAASGPTYELIRSDLVEAQLIFLESQGVFLRESLELIFEAGPEAHSSRRIRRAGSRGLLALKDFRICFSVEGQRIELIRLLTGYALAQIADEGLLIHGEFVRHFGHFEATEWLIGTD